MVIFNLTNNKIVSRSSRKLFKMLAEDTQKVFAIFVYFTMSFLS